MQSTAYNSGTPSLSIITVNLNSRAGLAQTLESVREQRDCPSFEQIVIDGGSTDGSVDLLRDASGRLTAWVSEPDRGIYHAMNKGTARARGQYLLFLNSGDRLAGPEVLRTVFTNFPAADIVYGTIRIVRDGTPGAFVIPPPPDQLLLSYWIGNTIQHSGTFIRRELLAAEGYSEEFRIVSDRKFFFEAFLAGRSFARIPCCISLFSMGGISSDPRFADLKAQEWDRLFTQHMSLPVLNRLREERRFREERNRRLFGEQARIVEDDERTREALRHWIAFFFLGQRIPLVRSVLAVFLRLAAWRERRRLLRAAQRSALG